MADRRFSSDPWASEAEILDQVHDAVVSTDLEGTILTWNSAAERMYGYTMAEAVGRPIGFLCFDEDFAEIRDQVAGPLAGEEGLELVMRNRREDGGEIFVEARFSPKRDAEGAVVGMIACSNDITEKRKIEDEFRDEKERAEIIIQTAHVIILVLDTEGRIVHYNPYAAELLGCALTEAQGEDWFSRFVAERDRPRARKLIVGAIDDIHLGGEVYAIVDAEGREIEIEWRAQTLRDRHGRVVGAISVGRDLSDEVKAAEELHDSEVRYRSIFETAVEGIVSIDENGIVEDFNPGAERVFGYSASEVVGKNISRLMASPDRENHDGYIDRYIETGEARIVGIGREVEGVRKDGTHIPVNLSVSEIHLGGKRLFIGMVQDLTERKAHEREAEQWREELEKRVEVRTAELKAANAELEHFLYVISHDIRTPLRGIRNYVDFITEDLAGKVEGRTAEDLAGLSRAASELNEMMEDLLSYSRIGRIETEPEEVDLKTLIEDIGRSLEPSADQEIEIVGELPTLLAPPLMLRQIFQNLIENGLRYNESRPRRVEISATPLDGDAAGWELSVRDNGIGIKPEYHEQIFNMFHRLHSQSAYPGTGIGLASVRKAAEWLGGAIDVESADGEGSVFIVKLPRRRS